MSIDRILAGFASLAFTTALMHGAWASPAEVLEALRNAAGGTAWSQNATLAEDSAYSGQGLSGKTTSLSDCDLT